MVTSDQLKNIIRREQGERSIREYAKEIGCSAAYLSDILKGNRNPGPKILKHFNLRMTKLVTLTYTTDKK